MMLNKRNKLLKTLSLEEINKIEPPTAEEFDAAFERGVHERAKASRRTHVKTPDVRFFV